ncbi:MAG: RHS repeat-associated core domain-containing protein [Akkermansiaceae bacterium]
MKPPKSNPWRLPFALRICAFSILVFLFSAPIHALEELPFTQTLPENPGTAQLAAFRPLSEPLWPVGENPTQAQNAAIETLLRSFSTLQPFAPGILARLTQAEEYLASHPASPWNPTLRLNLGLIYYRQGFFSRALDQFQAAWLGLENQSHPRAKTLADRALGEYLMLNSKLGRVEILEPAFESVINREVGGVATEMVAGARAGLHAMKTTPEIAFRCGPMALDRIYASFDPQRPIREILLGAQSTTQGTSLWQNYQWAIEAGIPLRPARRDADVPLPLPALVHWKSGHFAAITAFKNGRYHVQDGTFDDSMWITPEALADETSGHFLIPDDTNFPPQGWSLLDQTTAETVWGRGYVTGYDPDATGPCDKKIGCPAPVPPGMAVWNVHLMAVSLNITDRPLTYSPPFGPAPDFTVTYNQREANHPSVFAYPNFGPKWTAGWISAIIDDPNDEYENVRHYLAGGGAHVYGDYDDTTGDYARQLKSQALLKRTSSTAYTLTYPDNSVVIFNSPDASTVWPRRVFMTSQTDPHGNTLTYTWNSAGQLTHIHDSLNQATTLAYEHPTDSLKITKLTDPFGREANFGYDESGRLELLTDPVGIESEFTYGSGDFIEILSTPYGNTTFETGQVFDFPQIEFASDTRRWIVITDPMGLKERVEYRQLAPGILTEDELLPSPREDEPSGELDGVIATRLRDGLGIRKYRNTFHWDTKTMRALNNDPTSDYTKAHIYQWLHSEDFQRIESILETEKPPLQSRIYYNYQDQYDATLFTGSSLVSKVARAIDDLGQNDLDQNIGTSQISQFAYNLLGHPTRSIDPVGREAERIYDSTNNIDLLEIRQKTGASTWETLVTLADYTDHLPGEVTDASGQTTALIWNSKGQLESVTDPNDDETTYTYDHRLNFDPENDTPSGYGYLYKIEGAITGATTKFAYNSEGLPATFTDSKGHKITLEYDNLDRLTKRTYPDTTFEKWDYLHLDVHQYTDRLSRTTTYLHNASRQLMVETDPEKRITQYDYCSCGAINRLIDPNGNTTRWKYDIQGRLTEKILPDGTKTTHQYDPYNGRLLSTTDALGQVTGHTYHLDNNLHQTTFTNSIHTTPGHTWIWDQHYNRPYTLTDGTGTTTWAYHPNDGSTLGAGQIHTINGPLTDDTITRTYDTLNRLTGRQIHGSANSLTRQFDALGRLEQEINRLGTFGYEYLNQTHLPETVTYPDGHSTHLTYKPNNQDRRLERIEHRFANISILAAHEYGHDPQGTITTWKQERSSLDTRTWHYGYDAATRLTSAILKNPAETILKTHGWQFDPGDNRIATQTDVAGLIPTRHNKLNQLLTHGSGPTRFAGTLDEPGTVKVNGQEAKMRNHTLFEAYLELPSGTHEIEIAATDFSENTTTQSFEVEIADEPETQFEYDLNGNLTKKTTATGFTTYDWDALGQLIAIHQEDSTSSHFSYDGLSRRVCIIEKDETDAITSDKRHLWDALQIAEERASNGSTVEKRFYGHGVELVTGPQAGNYSYRTDHLGSIREVIDGAGNLTARYDYSAWGESELVSGAFDLDFCYTGHFYHLASGLYLAPFRAYDAGRGRWLSADPIGEAGGLNLYGYVGNDPVNFIDPDGRHPVLAIPIIIGLFATTENAHAPANAADQNVSPPGIALAAQAMFPPGAACAKNGLSAIRAGAKSAKVELPLKASDAQLGKKFAHHRDVNRPGYRTHDEYRKKAQDMLNDPSAKVTKIPCDAVKHSGETHYQVGDDLLRLDPQGAFRSLYNLLP